MLAHILYSLNILNIFNFVVLIFHNTSICQCVHSWIDDHWNMSFPQYFLLRFVYTDVTRIRLSIPPRWFKTTLLWCDSRGQIESKTDSHLKLYNRAMLTLFLKHPTVGCTYHSSLIQVWTYLLIGEKATVVKGLQNSPIYLCFPEII